MTELLAKLDAWKSNFKMLGTTGIFGVIVGLMSTFGYDIVPFADSAEAAYQSVLAAYAAIIATLKAAQLATQKVEGG